MRIALIDYRAGNLTSVRKAFRAIGAEIFTPGSPADLAASDAVVVPGVGHFAATAALDESWRHAIRSRVGEGRPLLGICLGQQWLFEASSEAPGAPALGLLEGACFRLLGSRAPDGDGDAARLKVPHVGWNEMRVVRPSVLLSGIDDGAQAYFTHSYAAPLTGATVATTTHGDCFASVVERGLVAGVQFHPEKSGAVGLTVLRNFLTLASGA